MARRGWSTSNFLRCSSAVVTAAPVTIAAWGKTSISGTVQAMGGIFNSASTAKHMLYVNGSNSISAVTDDGAAAAAAASVSVTISANVWFHACGVWASATDRRAFLNGANKGTDATNLTPAGLNRTSIGVQDGVAADPSSPFAPAGTGDLAEVAIWNVALSDADVASLALGIHPFLVRPDKLVGYWDVLGYYSPENNRKSNTATMAIQGALSQSAHTRVFYPFRSVINTDAPASSAYRMFAVFD